MLILRWVIRIVRACVRGNGYGLGVIERALTWLAWSTDASSTTLRAPYRSAVECARGYVRPDRGEDIGRASGEGTRATDATLSDTYCTSRHQGGAYAVIRVRMSSERTARGRRGRRARHDMHRHATPKVNTINRTI